MPANDVRNGCWGKGLCLAFLRDGKLYWKKMVSLRNSPSPNMHGPG